MRANSVGFAAVLLLAVSPTLQAQRSAAPAARFELTVEGHTAFLAYEQTNDTLTIVHTEVPTPLRGRHLGERLVDFAMDFARRQGLRTSIVCPFARTYLRRHPPSSATP